MAVSLCGQSRNYWAATRKLPQSTSQSQNVNKSLTLKPPTHQCPIYGTKLFYASHGIKKGKTGTGFLQPSSKTEILSHAVSTFSILASWAFSVPQSWITPLAHNVKRR